MSKQFFLQTGKQLLEDAGEGVNGQFLLFQHEGDHEVLWESSDFQAKDVRDRLMLACCKRQRTVEIHSGETDSLLTGLTGHDIGSAICSPVIDKYHALIGVLILWTSESGALDKPQRYALERTTRQVVGKMSAIKFREEGNSSNFRRSPYEFLHHPLTSILVLSLIVFLIAWSFRPVPKPAAPPVSPAAYEEGTPELVAVGFLTYLREGNYPEAWSKLSPALQNSWSQSAFTEEMEGLAKTQSLVERVKARQISRIVKNDEVTVIILFESGLAGDAGRWTWNLKKEPDGWTVISLSGPVERSAPGDEI